VAEASAACLVAAKTITRRLPALREHGAVKDSNGQWRIPVEALLAVGLTPGKPTGPDSVPGQSTVNVQAEMDGLRHRAELAEALLAAERRTTEALTLALRALTAGVPPAPAATVEAPEQEQDTAPAKRRGWRWLRGGDRS